MSARHSENRLDVSGLLCPLPVLKARKRLSTMASGEELTVIATDPMSAIDVPHFCAEQGHTLLDSAARENSYVFRIRCK
ncbi:MAG: sulfurtransferase TusA family protein [Rhizobiales bacterium]|nr:sulfurtransferase TusA family protein [Hyphomicrobiales bacterium]